MSRLALYLLGPPCIELDGEPVHIGRRKAVALLAYLAVERHSHRREALAALLWPEFDHSGARAELRRALSTLNRALGSGVRLTDRESVGLNPDASVRVDVEQFRQLWADAQADSHVHDAGAGCDAHASLLDEAISLYRDDFMTGFTLPDAPAFDEWQHFESQRLRAELGNALKQLAACHGVQGAYEPAIAYAQRRVELDRLHEPAHRQLMELYAQAGDRNAALRQYQECVRILKEELELPPSAETAALYERIRAGQAAGQGPEPAPSIPHNLPLQSTPFVGREQELAELDGLIGDPKIRLITIIGSGGIGKTRLALAVAERQLLMEGQPISAGSVGPKGMPGKDLCLADANRFPDGVYFVPLARMTAEDEMAPVVAEVLGFRLGGPEDSRTGRQQVLDYLREKRLLLLLDNFEHLRGSPRALPESPPTGGIVGSPPFGKTEEGERGGVSFVTDVLRTAPDVQLLVTSRERLPLREEQAFPISGLEYPDTEQDAVADYAAARLFLQAARRTEPFFELATDDAACLSRVCRLLEGMPLAIELAATWVDLLSLDNIAAEIQRGLDFLAAEWHDAPARHRSVRAAIDASWNRLTETERAVYAQLCVFLGGFTREAAKEVAGADLRTLARLADKSLLIYNRARERYDMHELLRQYGSERLAADPRQDQATRDCHSAYYCDALGRWGDAMNRGRRTEAAIDLEADWANVRVAFEWTADQGNVSRLDFALDGLWHVITGLGREADGEMLYQRAIDGLAEEIGLRDAKRKRILAKAYLLRCDCSLSLGLPHQDLVRSGLQESKALLEDPALSGVDTRAERAWLHVVLARQAMPDWEAAQRHLQRALALQRDLGYKGQVAYRIVSSGRMDYLMGKSARGIRDVETALGMFRAMGNQIGTLYALYVLGRITIHGVGDLSQAASLNQEAFAVASELGSTFFQARTLIDIGISAMLQGQYEKAEKLLLDSCQIAYQSGNVYAHCQAVQLLGETAWYQGDVDDAERRWNELQAMASEARLAGYDIQAHRWLSYTACARGGFDRAEALCERALSRAAEGDHVARGTVTLALARATFFRGDTSRSIELFRKCHQLLNRIWDSQDQIRSAEGLSWVLAGRDSQDHVRSLEGLSWALVDVDRYEDTARLFGFLAAERERTGMILPPVDQPHHERALNAAREGLGEEAFAAAWEAGAALTLEEAVDFALAISP